MGSDCCLRVGWLPTCLAQRRAIHVIVTGAAAELNRTRIRIRTPDPHRVIGSKLQRPVLRSTSPIGIASSNCVSCAPPHCTTGRLSHSASSTLCTRYAVLLTCGVISYFFSSYGTLYSLLSAVYCTRVLYTLTAMQELSAPLAFVARRIRARVELEGGARYGLRAAQTVRRSRAGRRAYRQRTAARLRHAGPLRRRLCSSCSSTLFHLILLIRTICFTSHSLLFLSN